MQEEDGQGKMMNNIRFCQILLTDDQGRVIGIYFNETFNPLPLLLVSALGDKAKEVLYIAASFRVKIINDAPFVDAVFGQVAPGNPLPTEQVESAVALCSGR
jgi:type III secretory pathway component EscU